MADDILRQHNGVVVADEAITGPTHPLPTLRTPGLGSQTQSSERPGVLEGVAEVPCVPKPGAESLKDNSLAVRGLLPLVLSVLFLLKAIWEASS